MLANVLKTSTDGQAGARIETRIIVVNYRHRSFVPMVTKKRIDAYRLRSGAVRLRVCKELQQRSELVIVEQFAEVGRH